MALGGDAPFIVVDDAFVDKLAARVRELKVGNDLEDDVAQGR